MLGKRQWHIKSKRRLQTPLSIFTACDPRYLKHIPPLLRSLEIFSPGFDLIVHVVNASESDLAFCSELAREAKRTSFSVSHEINEALETWSDAKRKAYFASVRFVLVNGLMTGACPIMCLDADSLIINPIDLDLCAEVVDVALMRRDLDGVGRPEHLRVAAGVVVFFPTAGAKAFAGKLALRLTEKFATGNVEWFVDQEVLYRVMTSMVSSVAVGNLRGKYADFELYKTSSVLWSAKGDSKEFAEPFASLQKVLGNSEYEKIQAKQVLNRAQERAPAGRVNAFYQRWPVLQTRLPRSGTLYLPRLDLPWKRYRTLNPPVVSDDTVAVRLRWKAFAVHLASRLEAAGIRMEIREIPAWEIKAERVNTDSGDFAIIPHRCRFELPGLTIPAAFYMQEYLPWLFSLDTQGWGAGASIYPVDAPRDYQSVFATFERCRDLLTAGELGTKFAQPNRHVPSGPASRPAIAYDIFYPLQIPHDQVIEYFSEVDEMDLVTRLAEFARRNNLSLALKPHPANAKAMQPFEALADGKNVFWRQDNIHDLIEQSRTVFTINSSVGFEAMLHGRPIVTFGRTPYDCVTIRAESHDLPAAWAEALSQSKVGDFTAYKALFNWYCEQYAVDMSHAESRDASLTRQIDALISAFYVKV